MLFIYSIPLLVIIGPAVMTAFPDAEFDSVPSETSLFFLLPQIFGEETLMCWDIYCTIHVPFSSNYQLVTFGDHVAYCLILAELSFLISIARRHLWLSVRTSPAWAWGSRQLDTAWLHNEEKQWTFSGFCVWQSGTPQRQTGPFDSSRSRRRLSGGLCHNCFLRKKGESSDRGSNNTH